MVAPDRELLQLREEARKARRNSTAKANRLRKQGIIVQGTENDPRRAAGIEKTYNKKQLRSYIRSLSTFNARSTQFVAGSAGRAISKMTIARLQAAAKYSNARARARMTRVADSRMPGTDDTFSEAKATKKTRQSPVPATTFDEVAIVPSNLRGESGARALIRTLQRRSSPGGRRRMVERGAASVYKILGESEGGFAADRFNSLTVDQKEYLMNIDAFWDSARAYGSERSAGGGNDQELAAELGTWFDRAEQVLPREG